MKEGRKGKWPGLNDKKINNSPLQRILIAINTKR